MMTTTVVVMTAEASGGGGNSALLGAVMIAVFSSTGAWGMLQWILDRRRLVRDDVKHQKETEDRALADNRLLAEAQSTAQRTALESANARYGDLHKDYEACRDGLRELRRATALVIVAFEGVLTRARPGEDGSMIIVVQAAELEAARRAVDEARDHLS